MLLLHDVCCLWTWLRPKLVEAFPGAVVDKHDLLFMRGTLGQIAFDRKRNNSDLILVGFELGVTIPDSHLAGANFNPIIVTGFHRIPSHLDSWSWLWPTTSGKNTEKIFQKINHIQTQIY